ncbi:(deoxy)nucleoside triphosphate pyrophosphohydrolase [Actinopolymorpha singaporensis]|uniref:(deoxy)nucleoside triphosphate pyrophosphohydrolase n=1 Tax=Actinopolymorpha singaporensis TaxID=117157 RepID=UPI0018D2AD1B|nr:(deoxy)nucleoside triphosphate pyrophosphohydrolase [Actinopolymorpha singaporensis]
MSGPAIVVGAAIVRDGLLLAQQRAYPEAVAGRWELPGGRVEPGESEAAAVVRECQEELGVDVAVHDRIGPDVSLAGGEFVLRIHAATLTDPDAEPVAHEHRALRWVHAEDLDNLDWLEADRILLPALHALLVRPDA